MSDNRYPGEWGPGGHQPAPGWGTTQPGPPPAAYPDRRTTNPLLWVIVALLVVLVVIATATATWWFLSQRSGVNGAASPAPAPAQNLVIEPGKEVEPVRVAPTAPVSERPEHPTIPVAGVPANPSAQSGAPAGDFNNVYTGSTVTSAPFALNVRDAYVLNYLETGSLDAVLRVASPVTGQTYSMNCRDNGAYVTCTGGNDAIVHIA